MNTSEDASPRSWPGSDSDLHDTLTRPYAAELVESIANDSDNCSWCFTPLYTPDPKSAKAEAESLSVGATKGAFYAKGHRLDDDGTVASNPSSRNRRAPGVDYDRAAPPTVAGGRQKSAGMVACPNCGLEANAPPSTPNRSKGELFDHFGNIVEHLPDRVAATSERGHQVLAVAGSCPELQGRSIEVLADAVFAAIQSK